MEQPRKPKGSPNGAGGQYDRNPHGTTPLPGLDADAPEPGRDADALTEQLFDPFLDCYQDRYINHTDLTGGWRWYPEISATYGGRTRVWHTGADDGRGRWEDHDGMDGGPRITVTDFNQAGVDIRFERELHSGAIVVTARNLRTGEETRTAAWSSMEAADAFDAVLETARHEGRLPDDVMGSHACFASFPQADPEGFADAALDGCRVRGVTYEGRMVDGHVTAMFSDGSFRLDDGTDIGVGAFRPGRVEYLINDVRPRGMVHVAPAVAGESPIWAAVRRNGCRVDAELTSGERVSGRMTSAGRVGMTLRTGDGRRVRVEYADAARLSADPSDRAPITVRGAADYGFGPGYARRWCRLQRLRHAAHGCRPVTVSWTGADGRRRRMCGVLADYTAERAVVEADGRMVEIPNGDVVRLSVDV
ncbi:hypothetical protein [Bifidobacterium castoris]|uniref:Uncharacterized protein n=1 Tax=Bifidobacterium castoris TaxID=2306972 RepID=A0A430FA99_9BIFI|nr:hypothetical protein [Bifidobacterium castoris]RSX49764.1 hypothetical protein D2E22_0225 [Bifidobacterium castoris]